jgi:hypothetical protein
MTLSEVMLADMDTILTDQPVYAEKGSVPVGTQLAMGQCLFLVFCFKL